MTKLRKHVGFVLLQEIEKINGTRSILKTGYQPNTNISIKLLIRHLKCSCLVYARQVFDEMPQRTLTAFNYMIAGYTKNGDVW